jgi:hypothetical protein
VLDGSALLLAGFVAVTSLWILVGICGTTMYRRKK